MGVLPPPGWSQPVHCKEGQGSNSRGDSPAHTAHPVVHSLRKLICKSTHTRGSGLRWGPRDLPCCVYLLQSRSASQTEQLLKEDMGTETSEFRLGV